MKKWRYEIALGYTLVVLAMVLGAYWLIGSPWVLVMAVFALIPYIAVQ